MKTFLAIYTGTPGSMATWDALPDQERKERQAAGVAAWYAWVDKNKETIVDVGSPLGKTKSASPSGVSDIKNNMTAYTVVRAESHEAAARIFENHPHFTIFPGAAIEVMECLPIPSP